MVRNKWRTDVDHERKCSKIQCPNNENFDKKYDERFQEVKAFSNLNIGREQHLDLCNNSNSSKDLLKQAIKSIQGCLSSQVDLNLITGKDTLKDFIKATKSIEIVGIPVEMYPQPQPEEPTYEALIPIPQKRSNG